MLLALLSAPLIVATATLDVITPGKVKDLMNKVTKAMQAEEANFAARRNARHNFLHRNRPSYTLMPSHAGYRGPRP
jgi:hypothetical protein